MRLIHILILFFISAIKITFFLTLNTLYAEPIKRKNDNKNEEKNEKIVLEKSPIFLGLGEQRLLTIRELAHYSLSQSPGVESIRILPLYKKLKQNLPIQRNSLLIKAISLGQADLWVWKEDGSHEHRIIHVKKSKAELGSNHLEKTLSTLEEIEVIFTAKGLLLRGEIQSLSEASKIAALLKNSSLQEKRLYSKEKEVNFPIYNETTISSELLSLAEKKLRSWLEKSNFLEKLKIEQLGDSLWLRGCVKTLAEESSIEKQAKAIFPLIQIDINSLPDHALTIYFKVLLFELKKNHFKTLGLHWPMDSTSAFKVTFHSIHDLFQIDLMLQNLESSGDARILSNPELIVRAPGEAELFAGGELPIRNQSRSYSQVTWKKYGLTLKLKVTHSAGDKVRLDIFTEMSHLDVPSNGTQIPGIQSNQLKTQVDATFGVPLFLSGLLQQNIRENTHGLPYLKNIPVLGPLFGSEDYLNERSELVAILYPNLSPPSYAKDISKLMLPRGPLPAPRQWLDPSEAQKLKESKDYPWNILD